MHWHILGAGAIGLLWAAKLRTAGHQVTLILRTQDKLSQYNETGRFSITHDDTIQWFDTQAQLADCDDPIDYLLITTKSFAAADAFASVKQRISAGTKVLLLHNGMGPQQQLRDENPEVEIWAGSTTDGAYFDQPFSLIRAGIGETHIGRLSDGDNDCLFQELQGVDHQLRHATDIETVLWRKLAINCAINPLTALFNCRNGELLKYDDRRAAMAQICKEVDEVTSALGISLFDRKLMEEAWDVAELTGNNHSSMQQDISHNRPTEIETITGYLCEVADQAGIATPANRLVLEAVRGLSEE
ncbi:2-dehydropantoate 2-reductase [Amphritea atlantica]|uniref:2-dehydropantoate 2-reductase n=1 Tax=Amphritea atlantica TaxID=355243 RepID=A0A1H9HF91_9GAMM|nr:2-dehydropantoate 2-reductase [Amphritea atlantica]SEQ61009.1 2-dehydropantoate 2-reductase [Amphritea atlantica]